jgi:hypothetical protein
MFYVARTAMANQLDTSTVSEWIAASDISAATDQLAAAFRPVAIATRALAKLEPLHRLIIEAEQGGSIGRKRRARRARGRRRHAR